MVDDVQLPRGIDAKAADPAEDRAAAEVGGVLDEIGRLVDGDASPVVALTFRFSDQTRRVA